MSNLDELFQKADAAVTSYEEIAFAYAQGRVSPEVFERAEQESEDAIAAYAKACEENRPLANPDISTEGGGGGDRSAQP